MDVMNEGIDLRGMSIAIAPSGMYIYTCVKCICCIQLLPHDVLLFPPICITEELSTLPEGCRS